MTTVIEASKDELREVLLREFEGCPDYLKEYIENLVKQAHRVHGDFNEYDEYLDVHLRITA